MGKDTEITWTNDSTNFWWGCQKVSPGCANCYAELRAKRWGKDVFGPAQTTPREIKIGVWKDLKKWDEAAGRAGQRRKVFIDSMGDFLEDHPMLVEPRLKAMELLQNLRHLDILILTKRPENYHLCKDWFPLFPSHISFGASIENQQFADKRIPYLLHIPCKMHSVSVEPMLGKVTLYGRCNNTVYNYLYPKAINWVICGGESGRNYRTMDVAWAQDLHDQCKAAGVPFYMKQDSGLNPGMQGRLPDDLWNCKEFPRG